MASARSFANESAMKNRCSRVAYLSCSIYRLPEGSRATKIMRRPLRKMQEGISICTFSYILFVHFETDATFLLLYFTYATVAAAGCSGHKKTMSSSAPRPLRIFPGGGNFMRPGKRL